MFTHVFAYGSLLEPTSLASTLPQVDLCAIEPAWLRGCSRTFGVAFPNHGSQGDKAYFDGAGRRPPFVLFADIVAGSSDAAEVNGILVPVGADDVDRLRRRELRYELIDVTDRVRLGPSCPAPVRMCVGVFVGRPAFSQPGDIARGVVAAGYRRTIELGVAFWEERRPGFLRDYLDSTELAPSTPTIELRRVDAGVPSGPFNGDSTVEPVGSALD